MALLGDGFPAEKRQAFVEGKLVPGCIVRIDVKFSETTNPKFLVLVADDDPDCCLFIVNSAIHLFVEVRPHLLKCQGKISADVRAEIVAAVKFARTLSPAEKANILASLCY